MLNAITENKGEYFGHWSFFLFPNFLFINFEFVYYFLLNRWKFASEMEKKMLDNNSAH